jgi:hypothetical protein
VKDSFPAAFEITIGLEGKATWDPNDPGGFTIWGLASRWNNVSPATTLDQAQNIYYKDYWLPAGCDGAPFPLDICLFDSQVNPQNDPKLPGGGNQEILLQNPQTWQEYNLLRMIRYKNNSKSIYVNGHINRVLILSEKIYALLKKN